MLLTATLIPLVPMLGGGNSALVLGFVVGLLSELRFELGAFEPFFAAAFAACLAFRCACATSYPPSAVDRPTGTPSSKPSVVQALFTLPPPPLLASDQALAWPIEAPDFLMVAAEAAEALASVFIVALASTPALALLPALALARPPVFALSRLDDVGLAL